MSEVYFHPRTAVRTTNLSGSDFLNGLRPDTKIYRYVELEKTIEIVSGRFRLTTPFKWTHGDPFEAPLFRCTIERSDGQRIDLGTESQRLFCSCWSIHEESDAMWRLYCREGGAKISTTAERLFSRIYNHRDYTVGPALYPKIGKVRYWSQARIESLVTNSSRVRKMFLAANCSGYYQSLLIKRKAYAHEGEVRVIAHDFDGHFRSVEDQQYMGLKFEDSSWIDGIVVSPRMDSVRTSELVGQLVDLGFPRDKISQSALYGR